MKRYIITILNPSTGTVQNLNKSEEEIEDTIKKEFTSWDNTQNSAMTSDPKLGDVNYQQAGRFTKDGKSFFFSILRYEDGE